MDTSTINLSFSQYSFLFLTYKGSGSWVEESSCLRCGKKYLPFKFCQLHCDIYINLIYTNYHKSIS